MKEKLKDKIMEHHQIGICYGVNSEEELPMAVLDDLIADYKKTKHLYNSLYEQANEMIHLRDQNKRLKQDRDLNWQQYRNGYLNLN